VIEKDFQNTLNNMMEGFQIIDHNWRYVYVNDAAAKHGHITKKDLIGKTMMEVYPGIEKTEMFSTLNRCMKERVSARIENEFTYHNGEKRWFDLRIQPIPEGIFMPSIDITEHKKAEEKIRAVEVLKMRGAKCSIKMHPFKITDNGIVIYPKEKVFST
jgi:PAS domain S-box-containing protein